MLAFFSKYQLVQHLYVIAVASDENNDPKKVSNVIHNSLFGYERFKTKIWAKSTQQEKKNK